jgi:hypothetical protein
MSQTSITDAGDDQESTRSECDSKAVYDDPADALGHEDLPSEPLCRYHILDYAE